jgi:hypothetical protein
VSGPIITFCFLSVQFDVEGLSKFFKNHLMSSSQWEKEVGGVNERAVVGDADKCILHLALLEFFIFMLPRIGDSYTVQHTSVWDESGVELEVASYTTT